VESVNDNLTQRNTPQAQAMHDRGLAAAGYKNVNSDDCWMLRNRSDSGELVPDPARFPHGWPAITSFIHSINMSSGLYTSKSQYTCAGFAASCGNEMRDVALFASWGCVSISSAPHALLPVALMLLAQRPLLRVKAQLYSRIFSYVRHPNLANFYYPLPAVSTSSRRTRAAAAATTTRLTT
jgi:hypothetical protein